MKIHRTEAKAARQFRSPALNAFARMLALTVLIMTVMTHSSTAQNLTVTNGLLLWLKADAGLTTNASGLVSQWADQSGLGNDAIQLNSAVAPSVQAGSLNGLPTLRYGGDTRYLDVANSPSISGLANDVTIFALVLFDDLTGGYRCCVTKTVGNGPAPFDCWDNSGSANGAANFYLGAAPDTSTYRDSVGTVPPRVGVFNVMTFSWGNGTANQYINDHANGTATYNSTPADGGQPLRIGSRDDLVTQLKGNVAEILIYQPALSDADRGTVLNYLQAKWNLNFLVPPSIAIQNPANGSSVATSTSVPVSVQASDSNAKGVFTSVTLLNNGATVASWTQPPYNVDLLMLNPGNAVLTAVAVDNFGESATSAPVSITVTGTAVPTPPAGGLAVWLRADAGIMADGSGLVTNWVDQSGNGNNASQTEIANAPVLTANVVNGHPALAFGSNALSNLQFLEVPDAGTAFTATNFTILAEARFADFASYRTLVCKTSFGIAAPFDWWFGPNSGVANAYIGDGINSGGMGATRAASAGKFATYGLGFDGTNLSHYLGLANDGTGVTAVTPANLGNPLLIGQRDDGVTQMSGDVAEILIYNHPLSATDQSNAVTYLSSKYGQTQVIVSNPPPTVSILSPADGAAFATSTILPVLINASNSAGSVASVLLLANGFPVVLLTNSPYSAPIDFFTPGTVSLTAVLVDNLGLRHTSAPVVVTVTGSAPTAPPTNDLRLWLSADDGVQTNSDGTVASWTDQSGNLNTAGPGSTSPTFVANSLNGKPTLHFNAGDYLDVPTAPSIEIAGDISSYAIVRFDDFANYRALWAKTAGNLPASIDYYLVPGSGVPELFRGNGTGGSYGALGANQGVPAGAYTVLGYEMAGQNATHYFNGVAAGSGQITASRADGGTDLLIGTRGDLFTQFKGDLAELLVFGHSLSTAEHAELLSYLAGKYGKTMVSLGLLPPTVTILSPTNGGTVEVSTPIGIQAGVTDTNYPVTRVTFFANGTEIGSVATPPYSLSIEALSPGKITLQAQAVDIWGAVGMSAPVVLTVTGQGPASPPTSGLVLWLRADEGVTTNSDGSVAEWADQSGLTNNAVQINSGSGPLFMVDPTTGKPALQFNGTTSQYLQVASAPSLVIQGDMSTFCAFNVADVATAHTLWSKTLNEKPVPWIYSIAAGGDTVITRGGNSGGTAPEASSEPVTPGSPAATGATVAGSLASQYLDGETTGGGVLGYGALDGGTPLLIGALDDLTGQFSGTLSELLIYNRALTGSDLLQVNTYLAGKYSIPVIEPAPEQSPTLAIKLLNATSVQISWPAAAAGFVLQSETALQGGVWTPVATNPPNNTVVLGTSNATRYFRLKSQ